MQEAQQTKELQIVEPKIKKVKNPRVLAYRILPNDQAYQYGNKRIRLIDVYVSEHLLESAIEEGQRTYKERFVKVKKELTDNTLKSKMLDEEIEETSEQIKARILAGAENNENK